ncbi:MAG: hypothetical protein DMF89_17215, partial [Acidobacteria bacterium]
VLAGAPHRTIAQVEIQNNFKYNSGQDVQPIFEGWSKTSDGSFRFHFGYLNRNYVQALSIPVGPANSIEPGGPDRGQPTFFAVRTNRNMFTVTVPKDWGKKELVWTLTANGKTQKAFGWLQPEWEIDPAGGAASGGQTDKELLNNKAPTITVTAPSAVTLPSTLTLNATVTDDGIPKPRAPRKPAGRDRTSTRGRSRSRPGSRADGDVDDLAWAGRSRVRAACLSGQGRQGPDDDHFHHTR